MIEAHQIEPLVLLTIGTIRQQKEKVGQEALGAQKKSLEKRQGVITEVNKCLGRINENLCLVLKHSPTLSKAVDTYQKQHRGCLFIGLRQLAASDGVFVAYVGLVRSDEDGVGWTAAVYKQPFSQLGSTNGWRPGDDTCFDHLIPNFQLALNELESVGELINAILNHILN